MDQVQGVYRAHEAPRGGDGTECVREGRETAARHHGPSLLALPCPDANSKGSKNSKLEAVKEQNTNKMAAESFKLVFLAKLIL